jgi:hypothetical protein
VDGIDLGRLVGERGPLPVEWACRWIRQSASALAHAQQFGLVHRDIKPSNLLLAGNGIVGQPEGAFHPDAATIKLLDLGLVRLTHPPADADPSSGLTPVGPIVGTPDYIAPEQINDPRQADVRADLYSLGCTFWFLLTAAPPFPKRTLIEKLDAHRFQSIPSLAGQRPDVPAAVAAVIHRLLAKRPEDRYPTPVDLIAALDGVSFSTSATVRAEQTESTPSDQVVQRRMPDGCRPVVVHSAPLSSVAVSRGGELIAYGSQDGQIVVVDVALARQVRAVPAHNGEVLALAFAPESSRLFSSGADAVVRCWEPTCGEQQLTLTAVGGPVRCLAVVQEGRALLTGGDDAAIHWWNLRTGKMRQLGGIVTERHWDAVLAVAVTSDGTRAITGSADQTMRLWDLPAGREIRCFRGHPGPVAAVALADGRRAISAAGNSLRIWDIETGQLLQSLALDQTICCLTVGDNGETILAGTATGCLLVIDTMACQVRHSLQLHACAMAGVAVSADGQWIATAGADRTGYLLSGSAIDR